MHWLGHNASSVLTLFYLHLEKSNCSILDLVIVVVPQEKFYGTGPIILLWKSNCIIWSGGASSLVIDLTS